MRIPALPTLVGALLLLPGCGDGSGPSEHLTLHLTPAAGRVLLDDTLRLELEVLAASGRSVPNHQVEWRSAAPSIANVSTTGLVTAYALGTAEISAIARGDTARATLEVVPQFVQLSTGAGHACGITGTGASYCWGSNLVGELGVAPMDSTCFYGGPCTSLPRPVLGGHTFVEITAGGGHTCALTPTGEAYCWGQNFYGQLGTGSISPAVTVPVRAASAFRFTLLRAGRFHTCGITTAGETYCWGLDETGQLGTGSEAEGRCAYFGSGERCSAQPVRVTGGQSFTSLNASDKSTCALTAAGDAFCWGLGAGKHDGMWCDGPIGPGEGCSRTPVPVPGGWKFTAIATGPVHRCGRSADGTVACWGANYEGQLGTGSTAPSSTPTLVISEQSFAALVAGWSHACGLSSSGMAYCWGSNLLGQIGTGIMGSRWLTPTPVTGDHTYTSIASNSSAGSTCGVSTSGRAFCWGDGRFGQLGNGRFDSSPRPVQVRLLP